MLKLSLYSLLRQSLPLWSEEHITLLNEISCSAAVHLPPVSNGLIGQFGSAKIYFNMIIFCGINSHSGTKIKTLSYEDKEKLT